MPQVKLEKAEVFAFRFQLEKPFRIALGATTEKTEIIVALYDNYGRVGWGEASPSALILGCTPNTVLSALDLLIPAVLGEDPRRLSFLVEKMDRVLWETLRPRLRWISRSMTSWERFTASRSGGFWAEVSLSP